MHERHDISRKTSTHEKNKKKVGHESEIRNEINAGCIEEIEVAQVLNPVDKRMEDVRILDSGCSFHMCPKKEWFSDIRCHDLGSVMLGNKQVCKIKGIGNIKFKLYGGSIKIMTSARLIPKLRRNLIFLGIFESRGFSFKSQNGLL